GETRQRRLHRPTPSSLSERRIANQSAACGEEMFHAKARPPSKRGLPTESARARFPASPGAGPSRGASSQIAPATYQSALRERTNRSARPLPPAAPGTLPHRQSRDPPAQLAPDPTDLPTGRQSFVLGGRRWSLRSVSRLRPAFSRGR